MVRSEVNTGPAGGYALALGEFLESGFGHAWVLDDDMHPEPECLDRLWAVAEKDPEAAFVFPISRQPDGSLSWWPSWCGFILARQIVEAVGLPMAELFWWAEDTEYLQYRIPQRGYRRQVVNDAIVNHVGIRQGDDVPLWKYYYEARNMLYVHLHVKRRVRPLPTEHGQTARSGPVPGEGRTVSPAGGDRPRDIRRGARQAGDPVPGRAHE